jgi:hypothetical protein
VGQFLPAFSKATAAPVREMSLRRGAERSSAEMERNYGVISVMKVPKFAASAPGGN